MKLYVACVVILQMCVLKHLSARDFSRVSPTCTSADCVKAASEIMHYIDQDVNPCDDFYEFACGTFLNNVQLKKESLVNVETIMRDNYLSRIRVMMQEPILHNDSNSMIMAKKMHEACMNSRSSENGVKLVKDTLRQIGGWAVLEGDDWDDSYFHWVWASYLLRKLGFPYEYLVKISVNERSDESDQALLQIDSPWSCISLRTPEEETLLYNHMVDIAIAFGADEDVARSEYADVINFIKDLMGLDNVFQEDDISDDDATTAYLTISELQEKFADIAWLELLEGILEPVVKMNVDQMVLIKDMSYLYNLQDILSNTTERVLNNFIAWRLIIEHSNVLTNDIAEISRNFYKQLNKQIIVPTLWPINKMCSGIVESVFSLSLQAAYVHRFISQNARDDAMDMVDNIVKEFVEEINELHWMDDETRIAAIDRLANLSSYVAYPDAMLDSDLIEERYLGYQIYEDNLLASILSVNYHKVNSLFNKLNKDDNDIDEVEINEKYTTYGIVYYLASDNSITVPHRMLQDVVYNEDRPKYLNYGSLGSFIGHQIFHSIFEGSPIRQESEYYNWISPETHEAYQKKLDCVAENYESFYVPEIDKYVNSTNTKEEDIADIAGVQLAYKAYKEWIDRNGKEKKLPKLDYTPKQLFWISSAIRFCSKGSPEAIEKTVRHSYQSLKRFRVLGALRNSKHFSKDFHCPAESMMNLNKKCEIW